MKPLYLSLLLLLTFNAFSQNKQWTWISGTGEINQPAVYGSKGVPDSTSTPGSRTASASWTTSDGKLWLFGGITVNSSGTLVQNNDLWMFDPSTKQWTWKHGPTADDAPTSNLGTRGVSSPTNLPLRRAASSTWIDKGGNLWMFGGTTDGAIGNLADLWKYDPVINEWTWISGTISGYDEGEYGVIGVPDPVSRPPNLSAAASTVDQQGNFWLIGGYTHQLFTDEVDFTTRTVWKFDPVAELWTCFTTRNGMINEMFIFPNFGTQGVADENNIPPTRLGGALWADSTGHLYLFGGTELYFVGAGSNDLRFESALRNDLWRYDTATRIWTWISGSKERDAYAHYGEKGTADPANVPGARTSFTNFEQLDGNLMIFGGNGKTEDTSGLLNDLWSYNLVTNQWTWVSGTNTINAAAVYGTKGEPDSLNRPGGGAGGSISFTQASENALWIYGGAVNPSERLGDLWRYAPVKEDSSGNQVFESFTAKEKQSYVELKWKIAKDQTTDYIVVEHSRDGNEFERLGRVQPSRRGNSRVYSYVHVLPGKGDHYYRLKHVSKNSRIDYSWVEYVKVGNKHTLPHNLDISFLLYPNPFINWFFVSVKSDATAKMHVAVYNNSGQLVINKQQNVPAGHSSIRMDIKDIPRGVYTVVVSSNGRVHYSKKIIKL